MQSCPANDSEPQKSLLYPLLYFTLSRLLYAMALVELDRNIRKAGEGICADDGLGAA